VLTLLTDEVVVDEACVETSSALEVELAVPPPEHPSVEEANCFVAVFP